MGQAILMNFPSPREDQQRRAAAADLLTPHERLMAAVDTLAAVEALSLASACREAQLKWHRQIEEEGRRRMEEFIADHVRS